MYFHYCLIAVGTILAISLILFFFMKKNNQVSRENNAKLVLCAVLSIICVITAPLTAKYIATKLGFSMPAAIAVSSLIYFGMSIIIFILLQPVIKKWTLKPASEPEINQESLVEQLVDAPAQASPAIETADSQNDAIPAESGFAIINEAASANGNEETNISQTRPEGPEQVFAAAYVNYDREDIMELLDKAIELKSKRDLYGAISNYEAALVMEPDDELRYLILLDLCSLYKKTNQPDSVNRILESSRCELLDLDKKEDILRNL